MLLSILAKVEGTSSMSEKLHIALSCNERYVYGALVAMTGVAVKAKPETPLCFHVFTEAVKPESIEWMRSTLKRVHENSELVQHECDENLLEGLPYWAGSRMAAVRCFYADLMPEVDWCLYLDCDVLYLASVEEHFSHRDDSVYACVVQEESTGTRKTECKWIATNCGVEIPDDKYFNSGVMLFNFAKMRKDGVPNKLLKFFKDHPDVPSPDQDALNATFGGCVRLILPKFNRLQTRLTDAKLQERPVVHYVGGNPWLPKPSSVANGRFCLWHMFADKYIWGKKGASYSHLFTNRMLWIKRLLYFILARKFLGIMFAEMMYAFGIVVSAKGWRWRAVGNDVSRKAIKEALR